VDELLPLAPPFVVAQLRTVLGDYGADGIKTGFLASGAIIAALAALLKASWTGPLVVDPVLVNHRALPLFGPEIAAAYRTHLLPLATLLTPNCAEAALLTDRPVTDLTTMAAAGTALLQAGPGAVLVTGGREGALAIDVLCTAQGTRQYATPWIESANTHGSGDTLSAAVVTFLAAGQRLPDAIAAARDVVGQALAAGAHLRLGAGHGPLGHWAIRRPTFHA
jgi:hydroxymethylpyrimidine kinase/phosphomethylpyrimidine kinase